MPGQYNVPFYAQAQPQSQQQQNNFLMRWLMMGIAVRIVILVVVPLLLCGGCAMVALLSTAFGH
jgi:heme/copper-type cytochrome/quinol oxidase subunit 2